MEDRRVFQRFLARFQVRLLVLDTGQESVAETHDVSAKGLGLDSNVPIAAGSELEAWLHIPDKQEPLYARGKVVWSALESQGKYRLGISLEKATLMGLGRILRV